MNKKPVRESWSDSDGTRARVLLEGGPEYSPSVIAPIVERHGFEVRTCEGPTHDHGCDLLDNGTCALVDGADVVVNMLSTSLDGPMVLDAVTGLRRPPGVVATDNIETDGSAAGPPASGSGGEAFVEHRDGPTTTSPPVTVIRGPVTRERLISSIHEALERSRRPHPIWGDGFC